MLTYNVCVGTCHHSSFVVLSSCKSQLHTHTDTHKCFSLFFLFLQVEERWHLNCHRGEGEVVSQSSRGQLLCWMVFAWQIQLRGKYLLLPHNLCVWGGHYENITTHLWRCCRSISETSPDRYSIFCPQKEQENKATFCIRRRKKEENTSFSQHEKVSFTWNSIHFLTVTKILCWIKTHMSDARLKTLKKILYV